MSKKPKDWPEKLLAKEKKDRQLIKALLKLEVPKRLIMAHLGFNKKKLQYLIDRWGLEEKLLIPRLTGE